MKTKLVWLCLMLSTCLAASAADVAAQWKGPAFSLDDKTASRIVLRDWTVSRGFAPDLVNYTIELPAEGGSSLRLLDPDGNPLPVQVSADGQGKATLSFVAEVPSGGTAIYWLRTDGQGLRAAPAVSAKKDGDALVLANQMLAVKVPPAQEKAFEKPVAAETLPAPILAFRGPFDKLRAGPDGQWKGEGKLLSTLPVKKFTVTQTANGPVFCAIRYRLDYAGGGWYEATVRVTDRSPLAEVREEYDLGQVAEKNAEFWQLDLSKGWNADTSEHMNVAGQAYIKVTYPAIEQDAAAASGSQSADFDLSGGLMIHHDSCWGSRFVSYYGIHKAEERKANPDTYPLAMVAPLHKGEWRRANSMPVDIKDRQVRIRFPMDTALTSIRTDPGTDTGAFSMHEHDPNLPASRTRRVWGLVLAHPTITVKPPKGHGSTCLGYSVRNLYGTVGLDRFKDFVLDWKDGNVTYPRVFITPEGVKKYREAVKADPNFALAMFDNVKNPVGLNNFYVLTGDPAVANQEVPGVIAELDEAILLHTSALSVGHHHALAMWGLPLAHAESVLSWPDLSAESRAAIRSRLALLAYLLTDPDVTSAGNGSHHGNPNMGIARLSDRSNVAALIPDHPMHRAWAEYIGDFLAYKMGTLMAPEGAWSEYGVSYHAHGYGKIERGLMGALADKVAAADLIWKYNRLDNDYFLNLLTPVDARFGNRYIPGMANSPGGAPMHFLQTMGNFADRDPEFAANLRWGWEESGRMIGSGADSISVAAMARPEIPAKAAKLTSRVYPGFGVIFRAHQGPDETCLYLRSGYNWSHWNFDQGNLIAFSKGATLLPPQPYQYDSGQVDRAFPDKHYLRFGSPKNDPVHGSPDSNILDAQFGASVDYAWHSAGYPDWYFTPGAKPGLGAPRERGDAPGTTDGAFTWDRQVAFLKSPNAKGPNYFVIRDTVNPSAGSGQAGGKAASWFNLSIPGRKEHLKVTGEKVAVDTEWPTKLDLFFPGRPNPAFEMNENRLPTFFREDVYFVFSRKPAEGEVISRDYVMNDELGTPVRWEKWTGQRKQNPGSWDRYIRIAHNPAAYVGARFAFDPALGLKQQQVTLRLPGAPGQEVAWVFYPRGAGEVEPNVTQLAPGVIKVVTGEGTDYVFLSTTPIAYTVEGITFEGTAGAIRVPNGGKPALVFSTGKPKTEPQVIANGDKVRFIVTEPVYVKLNSGNVGVRGVGPFDLTFTPEGITGNVDGGIRTIVCTWPEKVVRPGYWMDGVRWYAGFADEPSITKGTKTPQFSIAMGVSAGKHDVKIAEWTWPAMPPTPARIPLSLK